MSVNRNVLTLLAAIVLGACGFAASAQDKPKVVATFSILADLANNVGGDRVEVATLVGPDGDAHVYSPTPADGRRLADAKLVIANGLKFEGWMSRLIKSSGTKALVVEAAKGVQPIKAEEHGQDMATTMATPTSIRMPGRASPTSSATSTNIRDGLIAADPAGKAAYEANAAAYLEQARRSRSRGEGGRRRDPARTGAGSSPRTTLSAISRRPTG